MKNKLIGATLIVLFLITGFSFSVNNADAAALTHLSDTQTNQTMGALSSHAITYVTPSGINAASTTLLSFNNATVIAGLTTPDIALSVNGVAQTVTVGAAGASTWGFAFTASTVTITAQTSGTPAAASSSILIKIGTAAGGTNRITNYASATTTLLTIAGTTADTGVIALPVITNSIVNITATVSPTISFTIDTNALQFGTLSSAAARWATSTAGGSGADVSGNILTIATNSTSGFSITLQGSTLTASSGTIAAANPVASSTVGTPQFGLYAVETGGTATTTPSYAGVGTYFFGASSSTASILGSGTAPTATATYAIHYIANISALTPAGSYATNLTYIATPQF